MNCSQFRQRYSDFADGLLDEAGVIAFHIHLAECDACRRFECTVREGVDALRGLVPEVPSWDFDERLARRIAREQIEPETAFSHWSGVASAVVVLACVGVAGWEARATANPSTAEAQVTHGPGNRFNPFVVRFAGDSLIAYRGRLPVIPVSRDSSQTSIRPAQRFEITVDWMVP